MKFFQKRIRGFSIIELVIAITIFVILLPGIINLMLSNYSSSVREKQRVAASNLAEQAIEAIKSIRDYDWDSLAEGDYILTKDNGYWELVEGTEEVFLNDNGKEQFYRTIQIVDTKTYSKSIQIQISWEGIFDDPATQDDNQTITIQTQLTNWKDFIWAQTTASEFGQGQEHSVKISTIDDGEVLLIDKGGLPELATFDTPLFSDFAPVRDIYFDVNTLYVGTNESPDGAEFLIFDIANVSNKDITLTRSYEVGYNINAVEHDGYYAYLATNNPNGEVLIIDVRDMSLESTIDVDGVAEAKSLAVEGNSLFIGTLNETDGYWSGTPPDDVWVEYGELWKYNISDKGSPSLVDEVEISADINDMANYNDEVLVLATSSDLAEIQSRNFNLGIEDTLNLSGTADMTTLTIRDTHALVGRVGSDQPELYNVNLVPTNGISVSKSYSLVDNPTVETIYPGDDWIFLGLSGATADVFVLGSDLDIPESLARKLYIDIGDFNIFAIAHQGAYVFVGTDDPNPLRILTGPITTWSNLNILDTVDIANSNNDPTDIYVDDAYIYVSTPHYLRIFNRYEYSSGGTDYLVGSFHLSGDCLEETINAFSIDASGDYAYLATTCDTKEFIVLDISDPENPSELRSANISGSGDAIKIDSESGRAYLSTVTETQTSYRRWGWFWTWFIQWLQRIIGCQEGHEECTQYGWYCPSSWWRCLFGYTDYEWGCIGIWEFICDIDIYGYGKENLGDASIYVFDVAHPESYISEMGSLYMASTAIEDLTVAGDFLFLGILTDDEGEADLIVLRTANPETIETVSSEDIPGKGIFSVFYRDQKLYTSSSSQDAEACPTELLICVENCSDGDAENDVMECDREVTADFTIWDAFDASNLYEIGDLNVGKFNAVFLEDDYAYLNSDQEELEFMIVDISSQSNPQLLGSFAYEGFQARGIFIKDQYIYFITDHDTQEILIIGKADDEDHPQSKWGVFTSSSLNSDSSTTDYDKITWSQDGTGTIHCQIRTADTETNLESALWVGSDGTSDTYYSSGEVITESPSAMGTQWIQYRCFFEGDGETVPILKDISIEYAKT